MRAASSAIRAVFPACAGVIRGLGNTMKAFGGFPRMRGGDPYENKDYDLPTMFSPHARG